MNNRYKKWEDEKDSSKEQDFVNSLNSLHTAMKDHTDDAKRYLLKLLLEKWKKEDFRQIPEILLDQTYIETISPNIRRDIAQEYNKQLLRNIENEFFQEANLKNKYNIANIFNDISEPIIIGNQKYTFTLDENSWNTYFEKKKVDLNAMWDDNRLESLIVEKISQFLYWKPYKSLFWLQTDPQNTYIIGEGWQLKLRFE
jgi:hypothetical protein